MLIAVLITLIVLRKCKLYHKELGNSGVTVQHVMNVVIYVLLFCVCPIFALILFLIFDAKPLYNKLKRGECDVLSNIWFVKHRKGKTSK